MGLVTLRRRRDIWVFEEMRALRERQGIER